MTTNQIHELRAKLLEEKKSFLINYAVDCEQKIEKLEKVLEASKAVISAKSKSAQKRFGEQGAIHISKNGDHTNKG